MENELADKQHEDELDLLKQKGIAEILGETNYTSGDWRTEGGKGELGSINGVYVGSKDNPRRLALCFTRAINHPTRLRTKIARTRG